MHKCIIFYINVFIKQINLCNPAIIHYDYCILIKYRTLAIYILIYFLQTKWNLNHIRTIKNGIFKSISIFFFFFISRHCYGFEVPMYGGTRTKRVRAHVHRRALVYTSRKTRVWVRFTASVFLYAFYIVIT